MRTSGSVESAPEGAHPTGCAEWAQEITLFADGELGETERAQVETHLGACPPCRRAASFELALRDTIRRKLRSAATPAALRGRLLSVIAAEPPPPPAGFPSFKRWFTPVPVAAAGATALGITAWLWFGGSNEDVMRDLVARHSRHQPLEIQSSDARSIEAWMADKVDFRVKVPHLAGAPFTLVGARLSNVRDHAAVYMQLGTPQSPPRRISLVVYDDPGSAVPVHGDPKRVDDRDVYVANRAGYNVAVWKQNEVVYSLISDNADDVLELVRAANP